MTGTGAKTKAGRTFQSIVNKVRQSVKKNFVFATLNFLFIFLFMQVFNLVFGPQNSIVAIIMTILMGICAGKDVAAAPVKHFLIQTLVFCWMATAACFSVAVGAFWAIPINLVTVFGILYAFTYEYSGHLYFPYILSYLFLTYISPVPPSQLPFRLLAVVVSSACMILYALVLGFRNVRKPARTALNEMIDEAQACADAYISGCAMPDNTEKAREILHRICQTTENRRKGLFSIPERALGVLDAGRGLENLVRFFHDPGIGGAALPREAVRRLEETLNAFRLFIARKSRDIAEADEAAFAGDENALRLCRLANFVRISLFKTADKVKKSPREKLPLSVKLKNAAGYSPMRLVYALRVTLLLTVFMIPVQYFALPHGKWLMFTLASVSLPYSDDVISKGFRRFFATLIGGAAATLCFGFLDGALPRNAVMLLSGYLSFYFPTYLGNYACATVGAMGGAVYGTTGFLNVLTLFGIRVAYIFVGIVIAVIANVLICPFRRRRASKALYEKYARTADVLSALPEGLTPQVYYDLVVKNLLVEKKLLDNAALSNPKEVEQIVGESRRKILDAHRGRVHSRHTRDGASPPSP